MKDNGEKGVSNSPNCIILNANAHGNNKPDFSQTLHNHIKKPQANTQNTNPQIPATNSAISDSRTPVLPILFSSM